LRRTIDKKSPSKKKRKKLKRVEKTMKKLQPRTQNLLSRGERSGEDVWSPRGEKKKRRKKGKLEKRAPVWEKNKKLQEKGGGELAGLLGPREGGN